MDVLRPVVRSYAWGSRHAIAELQGRPVPAPGPEAELWMGGHPGSPSGLDRDGRATTLDAVIAADPQAELGAACVARFGPRLPFLLKVLAADMALSIQVHPSRAQAQAGYRAENDRGLAPGDPARNYVDDWPKPELLYALTPFEVLAGARSPHDAAAFLDALSVDQLRPLATQLATAPDVPAPSALTASSTSSAPPDGVIAGALETILEWPADGRAALIAAVVAAAARLALAAGHYAEAAAATVRIAADHPGDIGVVASLLLQHAVLTPGQAMFMPAGGPHAYLKGTGIELLANSDNVVRAGLTGKHIDVPELLKLLDPSVVVPVLSPQRLADGITWFDTPAPEFRLYLIDLTGTTVTLPGQGPRIVLCTEGSATLRTEPARSAPGQTALGQAIELSRGGSCFIAAADGPVQAAGRARLFLASPGQL
jgi:mannose-6-phosphate isomerase